MPLYFLVVKTNVSYACVASFIVQYDDQASITEALKAIKAELDKHEIKLKTFMLDTNEAEIEAVRTVFQGESLLQYRYSRTSFERPLNFITANGQLLRIVFIIKFCVFIHVCM